MCAHDVADTLADAVAAESKCESPATAAFTILLSTPAIENDGGSAPRGQGRCVPRGAIVSLARPTVEDRTPEEASMAEA
jgi:hypothetical protein